MTRLALTLLLLLLTPLLLLGCQQVRLSPAAELAPKPLGTIRIATWNVHYIWLEQEVGDWGLSGWEARKDPMDATLKALGADIIAFQEMESFARGGDRNVNLTRDFLLARNPDFAAAATGDARVEPPTQPIFYRPDVFELLDDGWFHFSPTPDVLYSRGFDGASPSFASWAIFRTRASGAVFRVLNIHPDAFSRVNRVASAKLTATRLKPWLDAGERVILLGDFNARAGSVIHAEFEALGMTFPPVPGATYHLNRGLHAFGAIDHIGANDPSIFASDPVVFNRKLGEVWPSDHHPVVLDFTL
ncbi:MAG: endonuclease/exonuclease/phosphatase family protein [Pseudomonadota bacterium]